MSETSYAGKIVVVMAKDHSSSKSVKKEDVERIRAGTATLVAIGLVMDDDGEKMHLSSFFTDFQGDFAYHDIHSILKKEIVHVEVLKDIPGITGKVVL